MAHWPCRLSSSLLLGYLNSITIYTVLNEIACYGRFCKRDYQRIRELRIRELRVPSDLTRNASQCAYGAIDQKVGLICDEWRLGDSEQFISQQKWLDQAQQ